MIVKTRFFRQKFFALTFIFAIFSNFSFAQHDAHKSEGNVDEKIEGQIKESFNVKDATFHHLLDSYDWEFFKKEDGTMVKISLPRILINPVGGGLDFFGSTHAAEEAGYLDAHHYNHNAHHGELLVPEGKEELESLQANLANAATPGDKHHAEEALMAAVNKYRPWDFSITKNVLYIFIVSAILVFLFISIGNAYKKRANQAPKGVQSFFEPVVVFIRDLAKENIPHGYEKYVPLLLTIFFFIWFLNMMGLVPFSGNVTGNISVTLALAIVSLIVTLFSAKKGYWKHILWPPVPHAVKLIFIPVEIIGIFTKPFALTIRLFANMTAGHVIVISLLSLIFIFGKSGAEPGVGYGVGIFSSLFIIAISVLELFVAVLQAFVFTMLTSVFIGQAVEEEEHH